MRLIRFEGTRHSLDPVVVTPKEAVHHCANKAERNAEGVTERLRYRAEALENMLGLLMDELVAGGVLKAESVSRIFDYDVIAEDT